MVITDVRAVCLPYCIDQQADGRFVFLNRQYKPIGFAMQDYANYSDYPVAHDIPGLTPALIKKIAVAVHENPLRIYLYSDGTNPTLSKDLMADYLARLEILAKLETAF